jgi:hypothetical protein
MSAALSCSDQGSEDAATPTAPPADEIDEPPEPPPPFSIVEGERGLRLRAPGALDGLTLISPLNSKQVHLVDLDGNTVHTWTTQHTPAGGVYFTPAGHLLRGAMVEDNPRFHGGGIGGRIEEFDWDGKLVWEYELASDQRTTHHDIALLPNGNILAIAEEYHSPEEAFARGRALNRIHDEGLWCDVVIEIRPTLPKGGEIVWEWRSFDHLVQDEREAAQNFGLPAEHPGRIDINADHRYDAPESDEERKQREEREAAMHSLGYGGGKAAEAAADKDVADAGHKDGAPPAGKAKAKKKEKYDADWLHTNAIDYSPEHDLIALSTPHMSEVWVIDHSTTTKQAAGATGGKWGKGGDLLYRWGNPRNYGFGDASTRKLFYQHDVTWQSGEEPGGLCFLLFNNGTKRGDEEFSDVLEFALPFDPKLGFVRAQDQPFGPEAMAWSYADPERFFSPFISGAQRLSNGNTLICEGARGRVFEVNRAGEIVWDFYNPLGGEIKPAKQAGNAPAKALFRATRIPASHPGLVGKF